MGKWLAILLPMLMLGGAATADDRLILSPEDAHARVAAGEITLIDVRRPSEWADTGVPQGAKPMTMHGEDGLDGLLAQIEAMTGGDKAAPLAVICRAGNRSARVQAALTERGYTNVHDVSTGVVGEFGTKGWIDRGLPVRVLPE